MNSSSSVSFRYYEADQNPNNISAPYSYMKFNLESDFQVELQEIYCAAPSATNFDVGSPTWRDLKPAPILSAMDVANLGHGPS